MPINDQAAVIKDLFDSWESSAEAAADKETLGKAALEFFAATRKVDREMPWQSSQPMLICLMTQAIIRH